VSVAKIRASSGECGLRVFLILAVLFPLLFGELMLASLSKLHLSPSMALTLVIAIFVGA